MKRFRATACYGLLQAMIWGLYAVLINFSSNFLLGNGFNSSGVSLVLGISTAVSIVLQLFLAELVSRHPKFRLYLLLLVVGAVMLAGCGAMLLPGVSTVLAVVGFSVCCALLQTLPAFGNSIGMDAIEKGAPINFSLARGIGSVVFSATSYLAGMLVGSHGFRMVPAMAAVGVAVLLLSVVGVHFTAEVGLTPSAAKKPAQEVSRDGFLLRHKRFAVFLIGSILIYISHNLTCNFMLQVMQSKGGGAHEQGIANAIAGVVELPTMFVFAYLLRLARCDKWLRLSCVFFVLKAAIMCLAPTVHWVYAAQACQMLGFGLYAIASVYYAGAVVGEGEAVRAQSYLASTSAIGSLIAVSTGGVLCQQFGAQTMLAVAAAVALAGAVVIVLSAQRTGEPAGCQ